MSNNNITITMSEQEAVKYYANKIIEDSLSECSEFNYCMSIEDYNDNEFMKEHQEQILEEIKQDERIADVNVDIKDKYYTYDMVFWTDYCPNYYEEYDLSKEMQKSMLEEFIDHVSIIKNTTFGRLNTTTQKLINDFILIHENIICFSNDDRQQVNYMLKETICNTSFFNKYLDKYKVVVNHQNILDLITELQEKLETIVNQIRDEQVKNSIKNLTQEDIDIMLKIFNSDKNFPKKYITLGICKTDNKYVAVDNSYKQMYIEEFDTREQAINYLFRDDIQF